MKAVRVSRHGGPEMLEVVDIPTPTPGPGEVLIRQSAAGLNFIDIYMRTGLYPGTPPFVLGREGGGTVEAVGSGTGADVAPGARVAYAQGARGGGYAEYAVVPERELVVIPEGIEDRTAIAAMVQGLTAHYLVNDTWKLERGQTALVHAAAGGVGNLLVQLAKAKGARVIATAGGPEKVALAKAAGADYAIDYLAGDFAEDTRRLVGEKIVDVAYDAVGKATWDRSLSLLRPRGMLVVYGNASGPTPPIDPLVLMRGGSLYVTRPTMGDYLRTREEINGRARELFASIKDGSLKVPIGATYPLADAARAHEDLEARRTTGKVLLLP